MTQEHQTRPGFLIPIPDPLLKGCRYIPLAQQIPLPGGVITIKSKPEQADALFSSLAKSREPFTMVLIGDPQTRPDGTLNLCQDGVLGIVSAQHTHDNGLVHTELLGVGRVHLGQPYLLEGEVLPRIDVEPLSDMTPTGGEQQRLEALVAQFTEPLQDANMDFVHVLRHFAQEHQDTSLNLDRVANILAEHQPDVLQKFIEHNALDARLDLLQQLMSTLHEQISTHAE